MARKDDDDSFIRVDPIWHTAPGWPQPTNSPILKFGISYPTPGERNPWALISHDNQLKSFRHAVITRDNYACRYCGFVSQKYQEVVGPFREPWNMTDLTTACMFCAQVMMLDVCASMKSGVLIWAPEVSQLMLNSIMRVVYVCRINQGAPAEFANKVLNTTMKRRHQAQDRIGTDNPQKLALELASYTDRQAYRQKVESLRDIRLLPRDRQIKRADANEFNAFPQILAFWRSRSGPFGNCVPKGMNFHMFEQLINTLDTSPS